MTYNTKKMRDFTFISHNNSVNNFGRMDADFFNKKVKVIYSVIYLCTELALIHI